MISGRGNIVSQFMSVSLRLKGQLIRRLVLGVVILSLIFSNTFAQKVSKATGNINALTTWTDLINGTGNITIVSGTTTGTFTSGGAVVANDALFDNSNQFIGIVTSTAGTIFTLQNSAFVGVSGPVSRSKVQPIQHLHLFQVIIW